MPAGACVVGGKSVGMAMEGCGVEGGKSVGIWMDGWAVDATGADVLATGAAAIVVEGEDLIILYQKSCSPIWLFIDLLNYTDELCDEQHGLSIDLLNYNDDLHGEQHDLFIDLLSSMMNEMVCSLTY